MDIVIHTLDARENFLLQFMKQRFNLDDAVTQRIVVDALTRTTEALRIRGIEYIALEAALVPHADRTEIALFFDLALISNNWYGREIFQAFMPALGQTGSHSVLHGDILDRHGRTSSWLSIHLRPGGRSIEPRPGISFCCIYVNNCSSAMVAQLHAGLSAYAPYMGYADMTYGSALKTHLSATLAHGFIQHHGTIIQRHEDDLPEGANQNTLGYPFEGAGFSCRSIPDMYFGLLLSYKIERPVLEGDERDQRLSLTAISSEPTDIADCRIEIDDRKFQYLVEKKTGSMRRLGVLGEPKATLEDVIRGKLRSQYLYRLRFRADYGFAGFNLLLELEQLDTSEPIRVVAGFGYEPERRAIRLVTMF